MQQLRIRLHHFQPRIELHLALDLRASRLLELRLKKLYHAADDIVHLHCLHLRLRHLGKFAESSDDSFQIGNFRQQRSGTLVEDFVELLRSLLPGAHQVLHRELQGKQRILQLVRQSPRKFPPGCHPFGLQQPFPLIQ